MTERQRTRDKKKKITAVLQDEWQTDYMIDIKKTHREPQTRVLISGTDQTNDIWIKRQRTRELEKDGIDREKGQTEGRRDTTIETPMFIEKKYQSM